MNLIEFLADFDGEREHIANGAHPDVPIVSVDPGRCHEGDIERIEFVHENGKLVRVEIMTDPMGARSR